MSYGLTPLQHGVLNNLTSLRDREVRLGDILSGVMARQEDSGTPVNANEASVILSITGTSVHGEKVTIKHPNVAVPDVYEFLADVAQTKSDPANIAVDISAKVTRASSTLALPVQPTAGDTFTIGSKTYIYVPVGTANSDGEISIGADLAGAQAATVAAVNGTDGVNTPHPLVQAADFAANAMGIAASIGGTSGNAIVTTETFTAETNVFSGGTLANGGNCSAANTVAVLLARITAADTQGVSAAQGDGNTIVLTAKVAGALGNEIAISETLQNGEFAGAAETLDGGVDGTESDSIRILVDDTNMYVCLAPNTISGKNWRKLTLATL